MAFFWAEEPSPFKVPVAQSTFAAALVAAPLAPALAVVLLSEPQPDKANVPIRANPVTLAIRRRDWILTILEPLHRRKKSSARWCPPRRGYGG